MVDPHAIDEVVDVTDDLVEPGVLEIVHSVLTQERDGEVDADDAARVPDRVELRVRQVPGRRAQRVRVRVRRDDRAVGDLGHVPEPALVQVRDVDEDAELVARTHQRAAGVGQAGAGVRRRGKPERDAFGERVRARPDDADRAQPARIPVLQVRQVFGDRLSAFDVHDRGDLAFAEVVDRRCPAHRQRAQRLEELLGDPRGFVERNRLGNRHRVGRRRRVAAVRRGDVQREEAAGEAHSERRLEVEVLGRLTLPSLQRQIVVTVDHHVCRIVRVGSLRLFAS